MWCSLRGAPVAGKADADMRERLGGTRSRVSDRDEVVQRDPIEVGPQSGPPVAGTGVPTSGGQLIRPMALEDVPEVVALHLRAFPAFFMTFLGPAFLREYYRSFLDEGSSVCLVACEPDGALSGFVVGTLEPEGHFRRLLRRRWWAFALASASGVARRPGAAPRVLRALAYRGDQPPGPSSALLGTIAVDPLRQRGGTGRALVGRWTQEAERRGARQASLVTDADENARANAFYLSCGWSLHDVFTTPEGRRMNRYVIGLQRAGDGEPAAAEMPRVSARPMPRFKRCLDVPLAALGLAVSSPVLALAAVGVCLSSPGPILYRASRVGTAGRPYEMLKLRTMHVDQARYSSTITAADDPRVFPLGALLRRTKVDELPQLVNVLRGEMSIVGPRPEDPGIVGRHYRPEHVAVLSVPPGLTSPGSLYNYAHGEAQLLAGASEETYVREIMPIRAALDLCYVDHMGLAYDLELIARTAAVVLRLALGHEGIPLPREHAAAVRLVREWEQKRGLGPTSVGREVEG